ncbi:hypothetical protein B0H10DRAFT_1970962 [Mycena sp. CBHHK59/15]|nr:hypothetical protein B0H10DRAFT_1970962 [Mycena sp. CBHHK59/15]
MSSRLYPKASQYSLNTAPPSTTSPRHRRRAPFRRHAHFPMEMEYFEDEDHTRKCYLPIGHLCTYKTICEPDEPPRGEYEVVLPPLNAVEADLAVIVSEAGSDPDFPLYKNVSRLRAPAAWHGPARVVEKIGSEHEWATLECRLENGNTIYVRVAEKNVEMDRTWRGQAGQRIRIRVRLLRHQLVDWYRKHIEKRPSSAPGIIITAVLPFV